jgi:hypothetical protein
MVKRCGQPSQRWPAFLRNHAPVRCYEALHWSGGWR